MATQQYLAVRDATGTTIRSKSIVPILDSAGNQVLDSNGLAVFQEVVVDPAAGAALGTPSDTAWTGSGSGSIAAILKALWTALAGTLKVQGTVTVLNASSNGSDASVSAPAALTVLATFTVTQPGAYFVQNQSAAPLQVIFDDGADAVISTQILASGGAAGSQGADTTPPMPWFTGRIQVAGAAGSQFMARHN